MTSFMGHRDESNLLIVIFLCRYLTTWADLSRFVEQNTLLSNFIYVLGVCANEIESFLS